MEKDTLSLLRLAKTCLDKRDDFRAVRILRKLIKEKRGEHYPDEWLADLYFKRKEWKPALHYARKAWADSDKKPMLDHIIGTAATACSKTTIAEEAWNRLGILEKDWKGVFIGLFYQDHKEKKVFRAEMISPCTARITSIPFPNSTLSVGDIVLFDRNGSGSAFDVEEHIQIFPHLDRQKRTFYKVFSCRLEQCSTAEFRMLIYLCQKHKVAFDVWSDTTLHFLGSKKQKNPEIYLGLVSSEKGRSHHVALAGQRKIDVLKVLLEWEGVTQKSYFMLRKH